MPPTAPRRSRAPRTALPRSSPSTSDTADVRARILAAASDLLASDGIAAITQPRVSRAAGVSQSHLTYYFPRRTDLVLAIARHALAQTMQRIASGAADVAPAKRLDLAITAMHERMADERVVRLILGVIVASEADAGIKASLAEFIANVREMLAEALARMGRASDPSTVAAVHALAVGLAVMGLARGDAAPPGETAAILQSALPRLAPALPSRVPAAAATKKRGRRA